MSKREKEKVGNRERGLGGGRGVYVSSKSVYALDETSFFHGITDTRTRVQPEDRRLNIDNPPQGSITSCYAMF